MQELEILEVVAIKLEPELVKSSDATNDEVTDTDVQKKPSIHLMWGPIQRNEAQDEDSIYGLQPDAVSSNGAIESEEVNIDDGFI